MLQRIGPVLGASVGQGPVTHGAIKKQFCTVSFVSNGFRSPPLVAAVIYHALRLTSQSFASLRANCRIRGEAAPKWEVRATMTNESPK